MFPNRDPKKIRPLEEEMRDIGLNPEKTIGAMERGVGLLEQAPLPRDISGLKEGSDVPRSLREVGEALREDVEEPVEEADDETVEANETIDGGIYVSEDELQEAFQLIRKMIKTAAEKAKASRAYKKVRSVARRAAAMFYRRNKRKISKKKKKLRAKYGGEAGLAKIHAGGKRRIQQTGLDAISNIREELEEAEARMKAAAELSTVEAEHAEDIPITPYEEAAVKAGLILMYLGECFEDVDIEAAAAMYDLSDGAAELAEELEGVEEIDEEVEQRLESLFLATARVMKAHYEIGAPTAIMVLEAIELVGEAMENGLAEEIDELDEAEAELGSGERFKKLSKELEKKGAKDPEALAAWIGKKKYGKEKMAKMAAQGRKEEIEGAEEDSENVEENVEE